MPTFLSKEGEPIWFKQIVEPITVGTVTFGAGDYSCLGNDNVLKRITEEEFLEMTKDMKKMDW